MRKKSEKITKTVVPVLTLAAIVGCAAQSDETVAEGGNETMVPSFQVDPTWPQIPNDWVFGITSGLSSDAESNIWVLHRPRTVADELAGPGRAPGDGVRYGRQLREELGRPGRRLRMAGAPSTGSSSTRTTTSGSPEAGGETIRSSSSRTTGSS